MMHTAEELRNLQPVVMKQLQIIFEKSRVGHAYIFEGGKGTGTEEIMLFFVRLLLCENPQDNVPCETCRSCQRIKSGNHPNFHQVYPEGQFIKVDAIEDLLNEMSKTGLEAGRKVYVIHSAERLNVKSANKLLKFLEEPEGIVTALFVTQNINAIIPTIRSRCQHIKFQEIPRNAMMRELVADGITQSMAATVSMVTSDLEEAFSLSKDDAFAQARKTVLKLVEANFRNVHEAMLVVHEDWLPLFKEKEQIELALDLMLFAFRDIVAIKANPEAMCTYPDLLSTWKEAALHTSFDKLSSQLQAILIARKQLQSNMNKTLMMEQLMLNLQEGKSFV
ncbi:DNA polymerase III subunit delta' [Rummeliibacillus pycnus]|uniref:DNA polymerase III subunit delta' n=1 Tax=Rummeliibacillus pycnus TaxID=101070 RepID=UPI003D2D9B61